ncbi:MAG: hypothetical protein ACE5FU_14080, partial [Nitrospinota bacterium]
GKTFGKDTNLTKEHAQACPCCQPSIVPLEDETLLIAYRSSVRSVKEIQLLRFGAHQKAGSTVQVSNNNWFFSGCPTSGPSLSVSSDQKRVYMAWISENMLYSAMSLNGGKSFEKQQKIGRGRYHEIEAANNEEPVFIWEWDKKTWVQNGKESPYLPEKRVVFPGKFISSPGGMYTFFQKS